MPVLVQFLGNTQSSVFIALVGCVFWGNLSHTTRGFELRTRNLGRKSNERGYPTLQNALAFVAGHDAKFWGMQP